MISPKPTLADLLAQRKKNAEIIEATKIEETKDKVSPSPTGKTSILDLIKAKKQASSNLITATLPIDKALAASYDSIAEAEASLDKAKSEEEAKDLAEYQGAFSLSIELNERQLMAKDAAMAGKSFVLTGAAGTGKTTTQRAVAEQLLAQDQLSTTSFKLQGVSPPTYVEAPSIAFCAYTRRASANLARAIHSNPELEEALRYNIMTIHALLEYEPEEYYDDVELKTKFRFIPRRHAGNPLTITNLVIEEASMLGLDLWEKLYDALPSGVQIIFIGDINQLPPVFGPSIMNYALMQLPVIELTEVYRQAGDSGILANAHRILKGKPVEETPDFQIVRGKNQFSVGAAKTAAAYAALFKKWEEMEFYDPEQDMVISPYNKNELGSIDLNYWIAQFLGEKRQAIVYEIIAGFSKVYLAVGDKVMYNKRDAVITKIYSNRNYQGASPQIEGADLSRFGMRLIHLNTGALELEEHNESEEPIILSYGTFSVEALADMDGARKMQASHTVEITYVDSSTTDILSSAGDFSPQLFSLGYVLTCHKAQGCEWRKVFIILHKSHHTMLYREWLYTAVTRSREHCILLTKNNLIAKAIANPRIKGDRLEDKIEYFNREIQLSGDVMCTK